MFHNRSYFCACAFIDQIYIVGGENKYGEISETCLKFDTKNNSWEEVPKMLEARPNADCTIYEGNVVVSGGRNDYDELNTVEVYDHIANKWSSMPNMIERRCNHSSVAIRNKLFIIGSYFGNASKSCEVFDSKTKKFVFLKKRPNELTFDLRYVAQTFSIESKLVVIGKDSLTALCYDVEKDEWSEEKFDATKDKLHFSSVLIPQIKF